MGEIVSQNPQNCLQLKIKNLLLIVMSQMLCSILCIYLEMVYWVILYKVSSKVASQTLENRTIAKPRVFIPRVIHCNSLSMSLRLVKTTPMTSGGYRRRGRWRRVTSFISRNVRKIFVTSWKRLPSWENRERSSPCFDFFCVSLKFLSRKTKN